MVPEMDLAFQYEAFLYLGMLMDGHSRTGLHTHEVSHRIRGGLFPQYLRLHSRGIVLPYAFIGTERERTCRRRCSHSPQYSLSHPVTLSRPQFQGCDGIGKSTGDLGVQYRVGQGRLHNHIVCKIACAAEPRRESCR